MTEKKPRKVRKQELNNYLQEVRGLERDFIHELQRSKRNAWRFTAFLGVIALAGTAAGYAGLSQPSPTPLVLRVDSATGAVDQVTVMREHEQSYGEIVDRYWLNQYVLNRESYDYDTIQLAYDTTALMSAPDVQQEYYELFEGSNARDRVLSDRSRIVVTVNSIQPNGRGQATVRFTTQQVNRNGTREPEEHKIATIGYTYVSAPMRASDRLINPLGFQVTSYRWDPETFSN